MRPNCIDTAVFIADRRMQWRVRAILGINPDQHTRNKSNPPTLENREGSATRKFKTASKALLPAKIFTEVGKSRIPPDHLRCWFSMKSQIMPKMPASTITMGTNQKGLKSG